MNKMENEYIQLPPLKRDTDLRVIMALWEYVRLSDEEREHVLTIMNEIKKDKASRILPPFESLQNLPQEEINDFDKVMGKIINDIIVEACDLACWMYRCKFIEGWTLEQMVDEEISAYHTEAGEQKVKLDSFEQEEEARACAQCEIERYPSKFAPQDKE